MLYGIGDEPQFHCNLIPVRQYNGRIVVIAQNLHETPEESLVTNRLMGRNIDDRICNGVPEIETDRELKVTTSIFFAFARFPTPKRSNASRADAVHGGSVRQRLGLLSILDTSQRSQCLVDGFGIRKPLGQVRV